MKKPIQIPDLLRMATLILGLLTISVSFFEYGIQEKLEERFAVEKKAVADNTSKADGSQEKEDVFYLPDYQATISSYQLHMDQVPKLNDFVSPLLYERKWYPVECILKDLSYFNTLFRRIISPNAP